jgi:hypothetical protein
MSVRRCFKQTRSFQDRLQAFANDVRGEASNLPPGSERDELLKKVRQVDIASDIDAWASSPGLQPPK